MLTGEINVTDNLERAKKKEICDSRPIAAGVNRDICISNIDICTSIKDMFTCNFEYYLRNNFSLPVTYS